MEQKIEYIVVFGSPFDGLDCYGPFEDIEPATKWAEENDNGEYWEIVKLYEPR